MISISSHNSYWNKCFFFSNMQGVVGQKQTKKWALQFFSFTFAPTNCYQFVSCCFIQQFNGVNLLPFDKYYSEQISYYALVWPLHYFGGVGEFK